MPTHTAKPCKDHLGNCYNSFSDMCKAYGKPNNTVKNRLDRNWTLEQALTIDNSSVNKKVNHIKPIEDHLGNVYPNVHTMAETYGITEKVYWSRKRILKWPLEKILTTPIQDQEAPANAKPIECNGIQFKSINALCKHYGIPRTTYKLRISQGLTPEEAVASKPKPIKGFSAGPKKCIDPWGNEFKSQAAMYRHYGTTKDIAAGRFEHGWTLEEILTNPTKIDPHKECIGPDGKTYAGFKIMAEAFGLSESTLRGRLQQGYSLDEAILHWEDHTIEVDHLGNKFASRADLYTYWNTTQGTYHARKNKNKSEKDCLEKIVVNFYYDDMYVTKQLKNNYYEVTINDKPYVLSADTIWAFYHNNHKELLIDSQKG